MAKITCKSRTTKSKKENDNDNKNKGETNYICLFLIISSIAFVFWILSIGTIIFFNLTISLESTVLTFVGILATFVVVSNYMQVQDVKREFSNEVKKMNNDFEEKLEKINEKINEINQTKIYVEQKNENMVEDKIDRWRDKKVNFFKNVINAKNYELASCENDIFIFQKCKNKKNGIEIEIEKDIIENLYKYDISISILNREQKKEIIFDGQENKLQLFSINEEFTPLYYLTKINKNIDYNKEYIFTKIILTKKNVV